MGLEDSVNSALDKFATNTFGKEMKDIDSVEQFIVNELPRILPIINTDKISIIGHSKGGVSHYFSRTPKIASVHWASPFDFSWFKIFCGDPGCSVYQKCEN
jgi:hypothetical protein